MFLNLNIIKIFLTPNEMKILEILKDQNPGLCEAFAIERLQATTKLSEDQVRALLEATCLNEALHREIDFSVYKAFGKHLTESETKSLTALMLEMFRQGVELPDLNKDDPTLTEECKGLEVLVSLLASKFNIEV